MEAKRKWMECTICGRVPDQDERSRREGGSAAGAERFQYGGEENRERSQEGGTKVGEGVQERGEEGHDEVGEGCYKRSEEGGEAGREGCSGRIAATRMCSWKREKEEMQSVALDDHIFHMWQVAGSEQERSAFWTRSWTSPHKVEAIQMEAIIHGKGLHGRPVAA
ncbi:hypothetical protein K504DRAFT_273794 [Pleomassaria siparia CBS 279.74]|uniref:Uncharacterized protein n=1 Tax=Pleomassaria siparia CBS 279.74 TaxID=1314801 RepID=A0A6G1KAE4_9PLEO|nr:hypothetical protein K504DRAFT_273794 [Pleomassaria siparia CBS 279.74]